jgi:hypothetical protein
MAGTAAPGYYRFILRANGKVFRWVPVDYDRMPAGEQKPH